MPHAPTSHHAVGELYAQQHGWVVQLLRRKLGNHEQALDMAQETFLRILRSDSPPVFREPRAYLTVASRLCGQHFDARRWSGHYLESLAQLPQQQVPSPESRWLVVEALDAVGRVLDGLGSKVPEIFLLSQLDGLTYPQIAERLELSVNVVQKAMLKAYRHCYAAVYTLNAFEPSDLQPLDSAVVEQALAWMVALQSGVSSVAEQRACQRWREEHPTHELAWQRLAGLNQGVRHGSRGLPAAGARELLQARSLTSRRTLLKAFGALGVAVAAGHSVHERTLLPALFSEHGTGTGERRMLVLASGMQVQLDTRTAMDGQDPGLTLNQGRIRLITAPPNLTVTTAHGWITTTAPSQLVISQDMPSLAGTQVQVITGHATLGSRGGQRQQVKAGQQCLFDRHQAGPLASVPGTALAWTQGMLVAERMPLAQLVAELDRYRRGVLRCDPAVAALQVSGSFSLDRPDASLELLVKVLPVRVQRVAGYWATVKAA